MDYSLEEIARDLSRLAGVPQGHISKIDTGQDDGPLRFSLAGVQLKFSAIADARGGLTIPATGAGRSWIVKLPSLHFANVPENEFSMMILARLVGIDVPDVRLVDISEIGNLPAGLGSAAGKALAVQRFDRWPDGTAVHIEDFAQVYPDGRAARLAPGYDFVSTISYLPDEIAALTVSRTKRFDGFTLDELSHLSGKAGLPERMVLDTARNTVAGFRSQWATEKRHLPLARSAVDAIDRHIAGLPIASIPTL